MLKGRELTNWQADLLFVALLAILFVVFGLTGFVSEPPFGIHFMRQTDGLSFAMNYHLFDNSFWKPELLSVRWSNGQAANEFPILYYLTSLCYDVFGTSYFWLRAINLTLFTLGLIWLQRLAFLIFRSRVYSFTVGTFLISSTVVLYYSANHLPDVPAMSFALGGIYYWFKQQGPQNQSDLIKSFVLFTFAGLLKVTVMIYPVAIVLVSLIQRFLGSRDSQRIGILAVLTQSAICVSIVLSWNLYMLEYNRAAGSNAFLTRALPVWEYEPWFVKMVWGYITEYWFVSVLPLTVWHILYVLVLFQIVLFKFANRQLALFTAASFLGSVAYMMLFYAQFEHHDYYFVVVMPTIVLLLMNALATFKNVLPKIGSSRVFQLLLVVLVCIGLFDSHHKLRKRFELLPVTDHYIQLDRIQSQLEELKIEKDARFLVLGDFSPNGSLYFLERKGLTFDNLERLDELGLENLSDFNLDHMLVIHNNWEEEVPELLEAKVVYSSDRYSIYRL